ncbi:MAG: hypothetical protein NTV22_00870, partial [bacterium]|nr:hypothetical protein [bacterium]
SCCTRIYSPLCNFSTIAIISAMKFFLMLPALLLCARALAQPDQQLTVTQAIFVVLADGENSSAAVNAYLAQAAIGRHADTYLVTGVTGLCAVHLVTNQAGFQRALATDNANIVYDGHANFGLGPSFMQTSGGCRQLTDFMNIGEPLVGIDWAYLCYDQGNPDFEIDRTDYADDPSTPDEYADAWMYYEELPDGAVALRYASTVGDKYMRLHFRRRGFRPTRSIHITEEPRLIRLVVRGGAGDLPVQRWRRLFIKSCYSGQYFFNVFRRGTLFYSNNEVISPYPVTAFVKGIVAGLSDRALCLALNDAENAYRPIEFPMPRYAYYNFFAAKELVNDH